MTTLSNSAVSSWLRQNSTVNGLALLPIVVSAALAYLRGDPLYAVAGGAVGAIVLLVMPGQGDWSSKLAGLAADGVVLVQTRTPASLAKVLVDVQGVLAEMAAAQPAVAVAVQPAPVLSAPASAPVSVTVNAAPAAEVAPTPATHDEVAALQAQLDAMKQQLSASIVLTPATPPLVQPSGVPLNQGAIS